MKGNNIDCNGDLIRGRQTWDEVKRQRIGWLTDDRNEFNILVLKGRREHSGGRAMSDKGFERMVFLGGHYGWTFEL